MFGHMTCCCHGIYVLQHPDTLSETSNVGQVSKHCLPLFHPFSVVKRVSNIFCLSHSVPFHVLLFFPSALVEAAFPSNDAKIFVDICSYLVS